MRNDDFRGKTEVSRTGFSPRTPCTAGALPALEVAFAALAEERPYYVRFFLIELVFFLVNGETVDRELTERIRERAMSG